MFFHWANSLCRRKPNIIYEEAFEFEIWARANEIEPEEYSSPCTNAFNEMIEGRMKDLIPDDWVKERYVFLVQARHIGDPLQRAIYTLRKINDEGDCVDRMFVGETVADMGFFWHTDMVQENLVITLYLIKL